ncbi:MAG: LytTR family DNA-binding domain-containing protein [Defluviitaleaceae bacterium]|nr:LytTR family DNA-binding domain-containing protein [Defluviitaleaceae bacterium]
MIKIAICDDEPNICEELKQSLTYIFGGEKIDIDISIVPTGESLCKKMESEEYFDIIFLDILFAKNEIDGVDVGRHIRNTYNNNDVQIVYISWEKSYAMQLFEVRPMDFLIKPLSHSQIQKVVNSYLRIIGLNSGTLIYKKGHDKFEINIKDIVYLENSKRKIIVYLSNGKQEDFYGSLKNIYDEQLKYFDFIFTHASFVANYDHITAINHNRLIMAGNKDIPVSSGKSLEVKKKYLAIMKKRRGV